MGLAIVQAAVVHPADQPADLPPAVAETEVVGFTLCGRKEWEKLTIPDLDVIPLSDGRRLLPLLRLLEALHWEASEESRCLSFRPEGTTPVVVDLARGEATRNGEPRRLILHVSVSEVTNQREIYIPADDLAEFFALDLAWDPATYGYLARVERSLGIWKVENGRSIFAIETEEVTSNLPEAHPPAGPRSRLFNLDFIRLQGRLNWDALGSDREGGVYADSLEQTLWGDFMWGRYKVRLGEDTVSLRGRKSIETGSAFRIPWGELEYRWGLTQVVAGDSVFGLNDLSFPSARITGLRFNGLIGVGARAGETDRSGRGASVNFNRPLAFSGRARVGSKVTLIINGLPVETVEVMTSLPGEAGVGMFAFAPIQVAPGSLNDVRIVIVDPDGIETVVEKKILGSSSLLPRGAFAYLGGVGAYRDPEEWTSRGLFSGTRFLYGLGNSATVGATVAYQEDFFDPNLDIDEESGERPYPAASSHAGAQFIWQPFDRAVLSGDISWTTPQYSAQSTNRTGRAWRVNADLRTLTVLQLHGRYFRYDPDFFDGQSRNLRDKQGYVLYGSVSPFAGLELSAATSRVEDNVQGSNAETNSVELQHAAIAMKFIPRSTCILAYDRLAPSWGAETQQLASIEVRSSPFRGWSFNGYYSTGDDVTLGENTDFLDGLRLPVISLAETRHAWGSLSRDLQWGGSLQLQYRSANGEERVSLVHAANSLFGATLLLRTEVGRDLENDGLFFEHRAEYPLPGFGGSRIQLLARYEREVWSVGIFFTLLEVYRNDALLPRRVQGQRFDPETGSISGSVFVDANANSVRDPGEPGLGNIKVSLDGMRTARTDERGAFLFPARSGAQGGKVFVDAKDLPAIYVCTHCLQKYQAEPGRVVEIHFGVAPVNAVSGYVRSADAAGKTSPVPGVRVTITGPAAGEPVATSIAAGDGSYYLENILPGKYTVRVDPQTIPAGYRLLAGEQNVEIAPAIEPKDLTGVDFLAERINEAPTADELKMRTEFETPLPITLTARDAEGRPLTFRVTNGPANGALAGAAPKLTYTPNAGYQGSDSFSFVASDGVSDSNPAVVSITVRPRNVAPRAGDDAAGTGAGVPVTIAVLGNDSDADGDTLAVAAATPGSNGTVTFNRTSVTYTPNAGFFGTDTFTYTAGDGRGGTAQAKVRVTVVAAGPRMHVVNIAKWLVLEEQETFAKARVTVADETGDPVSGATVIGSWSVAVTAAGSAVTNSKGNAVLASPRTASSPGRSFVFTVTGLTKEGWLYDPGANLETSDKIWTP